MRLPVLHCSALENFKKQMDQPISTERLIESFAGYFALFIWSQLSEMRRNDPMGVFRPHYVIVIPPCVTDEIAQAVLDAYKGPETGWEHSCIITVAGVRSFVVAREKYKLQKGRGGLGAPSEAA